MKQLFTILAAVLLTTSVFSQSPEKMTYQAVLRDVNQSLITNQTVGMQISILQGSATGTVVYSETQTPTTNINGLLSIEIGDGPGFDVIDWANGPYYLKTETDPTGGTNYSITGTSQLLSVPYALYAKTADSISGTIVETDPIFGVSVAAGITQTDTTYWNNKLDIEIDGDTTNELQYLSLVSDTIIFLVPNGGFVVLPPETDPVFGASVAAGITQTDTTYWNNKIDVETDPIFGASVASGITSGDTAYWNNKLDSYTETDPIFGASVAAGITGTDTTYWNNKLDVETDPIFGASVAAGITQTDTTNWNTAFNWGDHSVAGYFANGGEATGADRTLGNTDNFALGLKTNNATRLLIANNGNIGIGTTTPTEKLEVNGNIKADTTYTDVLLANKSGQGIYEMNVSGEFRADTLYAPLDTAALMPNMILVTDSATGQVKVIHKDSVGGGGGDTTYFDYASNTITTKTDVHNVVINQDLHVKDTITIGEEASVNGVIVFHEANYAVRTFELWNGTDYLRCSSNGLVMGSSTNTYPGIETYNVPASGNAIFRNTVGYDYGFGGHYTAPEIIVNGVWETQTTATSTTFGGSIIKATGTITDNDATPDVSGADIWTYAGSANSVTITDLDNPIVGATYTLIGNSDTYTVTIADVGNFNLSAQWVGGIDDVLTLLVQADNDYIEISRSDN